ncbi:MAG TPA: hypothetical protein VGM27_24510, partial [Acidobacteriaceae bacterium]
SVRGAGRHVFSIRADNLEIEDTNKQTIEMKSEDAREVIWHAHITSPETPWVAVIVPDDALLLRREVTGTARPQTKP